MHRMASRGQQQAVPLVTLSPAPLRVSEPSSSPPGKALFSIVLIWGVTPRTGAVVSSL